jgi:hypothetical protein
MRDYLVNQYTDFVNNYLTVELWAEHNGITIPDAVQILALALKLSKENHPEA